MTLADEIMPVAADDDDREEPPQFYEPWLFQTMLGQLKADELGIDFLYKLLDLVAERHGLSDVVVVLSHETFGTQIFRLGGREVSAEEAAHFLGSPGVHCAPPDVVTPVECDAIQTACMLTLALHHRRFEASHDALTGVVSRGGFDKTLEAAAADSARYGWAFTLVILDLDDFHAINRRFGLPHGDSVLRNLGLALRQSIRKGDTAARYGGDEFAVILKNAEGVEAKGFIERVHEHLDDMGLDIKFTYVVVTSPHDSKDPKELVEIASKELEKKKRGGR